MSRLEICKYGGKKNLKNLSEHFRVEGKKRDLFLRKIDYELQLQILEDI